MRIIRYFIGVISLSFVLITSPVLAADYDNGVEAYDAGDYETALQEFTPLAEEGNSLAQYNLGQMFRKGQGVLQNYQQAVKWYRLAAEQGKAGAQTNLGVMYAKGDGVLQNYQQAEKWLRLAAEQGNALAQYNLGISYANGQGVLQDYQRAHMWANLARSNGKEGANEFFDFLTPKMSTSDIASAQKMARECLDSGYKNC